jgi:tRNA(Ile)-lysidine synthase
MAATQTPKSTAGQADTLNPCDAPLAALQLPAGVKLPMGVAFSGGADSTALLESARRRWPGQVVAMHINHGLQAASSDFEAHVRACCQRWHLPLDVCSVHVPVPSGASMEDMARRARYQALAERAQALNLGAVLLAQHADDQIETLFLALSRGAGLPGLAAMPAYFQRHGVHFVRPLLHLNAPALRTWLQNHAVSFVDDPSNHNEALTRNRIRHRVLPALAGLGPWRQTFARSIQHLAQAQELLDELAEQDWCALGGAMCITGLQALSPKRQTNVVRYWLRRFYGASPSTVQLAELLRQVDRCRTRGHQIHLKVGGGEVRREGAHLNWYNR